MSLHMYACRDYKQMVTVEKISFYQNIHDLMSKTGTEFSDPEVAYVLGNTQIGNFRTTFGTAQNHARGSASLMHDAEFICEITIDSWADYVDKKANGSKSIIESAGFKATAEEATPSKVTDQPIIVAVNPNVEGIMNFEIGLLAGKENVFNVIVATDLSGVSQAGKQVILAPVAGVTYYTASSMQRKITMEGLPKIKLLYALCYSTNRAGNSVLSNIIHFSC